MAGLRPPTGIDGLDFSPLLTGKSKKAPRDYAFIQMMYAFVPWPGWRGFRTREYTYARTVDGPWILFNDTKDPYQMKNLVDDPKSQSLVRRMDKRLADIMAENGDSWGIEATTGDTESWLPGGSKQKSQVLGVTWPGAKIESGVRINRGGRKRTGGNT